MAYAPAAAAAAAAAVAAKTSYATEATFRCEACLFLQKSNKVLVLFFRVSRTGKANRTYGIVFASYTHLFTGVPKV